jgi:hypothetical protein
MGSESFFEFLEREAVFHNFPLALADLLRGGVQLLMPTTQARFTSSTKIQLYKGPLFLFCSNLK